MTKRRESIAIPLLILIVFLAIVCLVAHCSQDAQAEWIRVPEFGGAVSSVAPSEVGIEGARLLHGWYLKRGDLLQLNFDKRDTLTAAAASHPLYFLAPFSRQNELIFYGGVLGRYRIDVNRSEAVSVVTPDTCATTADSNAVWYDGGDIANSMWLNLVLADTAIGGRGTIDIEGTRYTVRRWLSDNVVVLVNDQASTASSQQVNWYSPISAPGGAPLYHIEQDDSLSILDGTNRTVYEGDLIGSWKWPLYTDSGTYDSVCIANDTIRAYDDSLMVFGDFASGLYKSFFLFDDPTDSAHGIPFHIASHMYDGEAGMERLVLVGDSSAYMRDDDTLFYDAHFDGGSKNYLIYGPGSFYDTTKSHWWFNIVTSSTWLLSSRGGTNTYRIRLDYSRNPTDWLFDTRLLDATIVRLDNSATYSPKDLENFSCRIERVFGLDSLYLLAWGRNTMITGAAVVKTYSLHRFKPVPFSVTVDQTAFPYTFGVIHRDRGWFAADNRIVYSDLNDYFDTTGGGVVTFDKNITALSSFGNQLIAHIGGSEIQTWSGYSEGDFYKVPAPAAVAAMNMASLVRNPDDNTDRFPHPLGFWLFDGSSVSRVPTLCDEIFTDSINWDEAENIVGAIYDGKYWLGCPFGVSSTNNRLITIDLETSDVTFVNKVRPASFHVRNDQRGRSQLWIGDADSSVIWLADAETNEVPPTSEMRSGWYIGDDRSQRKLVREYTVGYSAKRNDSLIVDFYTGSENAVWADTIVVTTGGGQTFGNTTTEASSSSIAKDYIYGSAYTPLSSGFLDSMSFYLDFTSLGVGDVCSVKVALYRYNTGVPLFVDSCYMRTFTDGETDGWKNFVFSNTNTPISAGVRYLLFLRTTKTVDYAISLKLAVTGGTYVGVAYWTNSIATGWAKGLLSPYFTVTTGALKISSYVYYSERVVQQHHAAVPRLVQGTAISYGLRSPSPTMRVIDFAADIVTLGRERSR